MTAQITNELPDSLDSNRFYQLPPLILHPFAEAAGPNKLLQSSRASLILQGLLPAGEATTEELDRTLLDGRYSEVRMLFYVGKDVRRWIEQCMDHLLRVSNGVLPDGVCAQSFAALLVQNPPLAIQEKLRKWGVTDYRSIFSRSLGLNAVFAEMPQREVLTSDFLRNYYRFADQMFTASQSQAEFTPLRPEQFRFDLYSSGEYARMLEREWGE
jgi:hypothetical protein